MSSPYPVLDNKPIDQWKVTELKEELKRRKLATKGLKDDLIKRLDEALRAEMEEEDDATRNEIGNENEDADNSKEEQVDNDEMETEAKEQEIDNDKEIGSEAKPQVENEHVETPVELDTKIDDDSVLGKMDKDKDKDVSVVDSYGSPAKLGGGENREEEESVANVDTVEVVSHTETVSGSVETNVTETTRSSVTLASSVLEPQDNGIKAEKEDPLASHEVAVPNSSSQNHQVSEVSPSLGFQVKSDSISTDSVSINQKNEQKNNLNADNFHIELDNVKPEMVQPSSRDVPRNGGDISPLDDLEPFGDQGSIEALDDVSAMNVDLSKKNDSADGGSSEKLNLDRSSGDDSMEEDVLESKQVESNHVFSDMQESSDQTKDHVLEEGSPVDTKRSGFSPSLKNVSTENKISVAAPAEKRKLEDQEIVSNNEPPKRRRWNTEPIKVPDPQPSSLTPTTPKDGFSRFQKRNFSRSDSNLSGGDTPKERVVPPSPKSPTTSLKIDRFLRPFTLKAVQELLGKTGTVCSFWMDHIKTHCFVTFSKVEEAIETRNALYNLQWPPNGGKLLVADFVDPQEVKLRVEAPPPPAPAPTPAPAPAPVNNRTAPPPTTSQLQPSPRNNVSKQQLPPPPSLPPPPPLADPHIVRERLPLPPPPLIKKPEPPIVTLDDLFRKTRATPRIYYLPLSEEQVAAKLEMKSKATS